MKKTKRLLLISLISIISLVLLVIVFISPITKYLIEKYDEKYTGRQIEINWLYLNPFTGYVHFNDIKIYEEKSDNVFFSADGISVNIEVYKLFSKTYQISELTISKPHGYIVQDERGFNFDSLIEKFNSDEKPDTTKSPVHFNILNVKINDGEFYYREKLIPINYFIKKVNIASTGVRWDTDTIATEFSFLSGIGKGEVNGNITFNSKTLDYHLGVVVKKFELQIIEQFLKELTNYGTFTANLDVDINAIGSFNSKEDITAKGYIAVNDFHFGKNPKEDYASFKKLAIKIDELSPNKAIYLFDSVSLNHPYFKYERYDYLDNIEMVFGKGGAKVKAVNANVEQFNLVIEIAKYIKVLAKNFFKSDYKINRLAIYNGDLKFIDYSISEKFTIALNPLSVFADSINKSNKRVNMVLNSGIKPFGSTTVALSINPKDSSYFDLNYQIQNMSLPMFNPYLISFSSFPLDRGTMKITGNWNVRDGVIKSDNHLLVIDPRLSSRIKNKDLNWLPMRIAMFFVRERGNVIDYQIPISGSLNDPKVHLYDVITDVIKNVFVKPPTTPYIAEVKNIETEIEKALTVNWRMRGTSLERNQEKFVQRMAAFLKSNPEASINVSPKVFEEKEKEYIVFFEAKKKFFLVNRAKGNKLFTEEDSIKVDKMSVKDSQFVNYLDKQLNNDLLFTIQDKCTRFIDSSIVNLKYRQLNNQRNEVFMSYFNEANINKQIKFSSSESTIPFYGFSFYKIDYKGEFPESVMKAYREMNELNTKNPRKKFSEERIKNKNVQEN